LKRNDWTAGKELKRNDWAAGKKLKKTDWAAGKRLKRNDWTENGLAAEKNDQRIVDDWLKIGFEIEPLQNQHNLTIKPNVKKLK
jgi:hypothetical protein